MPNEQHRQTGVPRCHARSSTGAGGKKVYLMEMLSGAVWLIALIVLVVLAVRRIDY